MKMSLVLVAVGCVVLAAHKAGAQDSFAGKIITITIGSAPGGSYDAYGRLMARHMGRHIPGDPNLVPKNMPGAGGALAAAFLYNVAAKDGTQLGATINTVGIFKMLLPAKAKYDVGKFNWIGTVASPTNVLVVWHTTGVKTLADARTLKTAIPIGATSPYASQAWYPLMAKNLFGAKFDVILGYKGGAAVNLAMEKGEVVGRGSNSWISYQFQHPQWVKDRKIIPLFQMTFTRDPQLKKVPTLLELADNNIDRKVISLLTTTENVGRSLMGPPGLTPSIVTTLRKAFTDMIKDPLLHADAKRAKLPVQSIDGVKLQKMVESIANTPPEVVQHFKAVTTVRKKQRGGK
jgi:tripartite-type tricarboxylate transporter receptor subunit TctC